MEVLTDLRAGNVSPIQMPSPPLLEPTCYPLVLRAGRNIIWAEIKTSGQ